MKLVPPTMENYEETFKTFSLEAPHDFNFAFDTFDFWAKDKTRNALQIVEPDGTTTRNYSYYELQQLSLKFANVLKSYGLQKGDRIMLMLPWTPKWYVALLGMIRLGILPIPTTTLCTPKDIEYRLQQSAAHMVITDLENAPKVDEVRSQCSGLQFTMVVNGEREGWYCYDEEMHKAATRFERTVYTLSHDDMLLYFTSGTTAYPKMVLHSQASYGIGHLITARLWHDLHPRDLIWTVTDTGWAKAAWSSFFGQFSLGATLLNHVSPSKFDPALTLRILETHGVSIFCAPPTVYRMMIQLDITKEKLDHLRHCVSAGEPLNPEVISIWKEKTGLEIYDGYGQTETVLVIANYRCNPIRYGSMGKPAPGFTIAIVDDEGKELPPGREGNIAIKIKPERPIGLFKGYWNDLRETGKALSGDWYYTGDRAYRDEEGYYWFEGRADDIILSAGYRIGPFEVESALIEHPAVVEAAAVAAPDELRGEIVKAFVVLSPGYAPSASLTKELQEHVKKTTAPYKYPRSIEYLHELPKTVSGKIKRSILKEREWKKISG